MRLRSKSLMVIANEIRLLKPDLSPLLVASGIVRLSVSDKR